MSSALSRPAWSPTTKALVATGLAILAIYLLTRFRVVFTHLILASILAFALSPLVGAIEKRLKLPRWLATLLVYLILVGVLLTVPALIIPPVVERLSGLGAALEGILGLIESAMGEAIVIGGVTINGAQLLDQLVASLRELLQPVFGRTLGFAFELVSSFVTAGFVLVISFYLVKDSAKLRQWLGGLPPAEYQEDAHRLAGEINTIWGSFFRGQVLLALIVATGFAVVGTVIGLPFALAMGMLAGLMEFLSSVGHTIWLVTASILAFFLGSTWLPIPNWLMLLIAIGLHVLFTQIDLNYLIPRIIGRRIQLHPLAIILGIIAGASVAGVLGIVLAAPAIATARVLVRYLFANLLDAEPFPEPQGIPG